MGRGGVGQLAATVLAPFIVRVGTDAATDCRVATVIEHVALYGADLPPAGQTAFARQARTRTAQRAAASRPQPVRAGLATSNGATICDMGRA